MDFITYQNLIDQNKHHTDDSVVAKFYDRVIKTASSTPDGLPTFKTVCYCEIRIKDNTTEVFDQPADKEKIDRFPLEYTRYQLSKKRTEKGTPLEQFAFLTAREIAACKYHGIFTVEELANLSAEHVRSLKLEKECELAQQFITNSRQLKKIIDEATQLKKYQEEITALKEEIDMLRNQKNKSKVKEKRK